jgi:hypothetical protein
MTTPNLSTLKAKAAIPVRAVSMASTANERNSKHLEHFHSASGAEVGTAEKGALLAGVDSDNFAFFFFWNGILPFFLFFFQYESSNKPHASTLQHMKHPSQSLLVPWALIS